MSLRARLLAAIAAALLAGFLAGAMLTAWQAARLVRAELSAALATGQASVTASLQDISGAPSTAALARLASGFDGSRHVRADLIVGGRIVAASHPAKPVVASPQWFAAIASPGLRPVDIAAAPDAVLRLSPLPASEIGERWSETGRLVGLLGLAMAIAAIACAITTSIGLRPLAALAAAFRRLEQGGANQAVPLSGPPEIAAFAAAFNRMQASLHAASQENARLSAQMERVSEEERAELARELHDEIGPVLFAVTAWAEAAHLQAGSGDWPAAETSLARVQEAAGALQQAVRALLRALRDSAPAAALAAPAGIGASLADLVVFWRGIQPQTAFDLRIDASLHTLDEPVRSALLRVAQEGLSNAIRHGGPAHVAVTVERKEGGLALCVQDDGTQAPATPLSPGFGLIGMEERLLALGGTLAVTADRGWRLTAWVPLPASARA